jgi:hypothetical protein
MAGWTRQSFIETLYEYSRINDKRQRELNVELLIGIIFDEETTYKKLELLFLGDLVYLKSQKY